MFGRQCSLDMFLLTFLFWIDSYLHWLHFLHAAVLRIFKENTHWQKSPLAEYELLLCVSSNRLYIEKNELQLLHLLLDFPAAAGWNATPAMSAHGGGGIQTKSCQVIVISNVFVIVFVIANVISTVTVIAIMIVTVIVVVICDCDFYFDCDLWLRLWLWFLTFKIIALAALVAAVLSCSAAQPDDPWPWPCCQPDGPCCWYLDFCFELLPCDSSHYTCRWIANNHTGCTGCCRAEDEVHRVAELAIVTLWFLTCWSHFRELHW